MNLGYMMFTTERQRKDNMLDSNEVHVQIVVSVTNSHLLEASEEVTSI